MLLKISIISLISALVFLGLYMIIKNHKNFIRRVSGFMSVVLILTSAVSAIIYMKSNDIKIFNKVKSYDVVEEYAASLKENGEDDAYSLLPCRIYSQDDKISFINSKHDLFSINEVEGVYSLSTENNNILSSGGSKTIKTTITEQGNLILEGTFLYSKYEENLLSFNKKVIAKNVKSCTATSNSLFYITNDDKLYAMGFNEYSQLGDTTTKSKNSPVHIADNIKAADISDTHSMLVDKYGTLYAVGDNSYSQLGNKTAISSNERTKIMQGVKDVCVGNYFSLVLTVNGELYSAGINTKGQLGNNGEEFRAELIHIMSGVEKICINKDTCGALKYSGELYIWGDNSNYKVGTDKEEILFSPVKTHENVYDFTLSENHIAVLTKDRDILISNENGEFVNVLEMNATVPEAYRDRTISRPEQSTAQA